MKSMTEAGYTARLTHFPHKAGQELRVTSSLPTQGERNG